MEELLYNTQATVPDSDNDGFIDSHELFNLYNPAGIAPERLTDAGLAKRFVNATPYVYEILIPTPWQAMPSIEGPMAILISDSGGARIFEIGVIANTQGLSLAQWYGSQNPGAPGLTESRAWETNKADLPGLLTPDNSAGYFASESAQFVYAIRFSGVEDNRRIYKKTFEMMLNSFVIHE